MKSKEKAKEKVASQEKAKRKTMEPPALGAQKKRLLASTIGPTKWMQVKSSYSILFRTALSTRKSLDLTISILANMRTHCYPKWQP